MAINVEPMSKEDKKYYRYYMSLGGGLKNGQLLADNMLIPEKHPAYNAYLTYTQAKQAVMEKDAWIRCKQSSDPYLFSFGCITKRNWSSYEKWLERRIKYPWRYYGLVTNK